MPFTCLLHNINIDQAPRRCHCSVYNTVLLLSNLRRLLQSARACHAPASRRSCSPAQAAYCYYASPYPKFLSRLLFFYMITLLALFMNFYINKHSRKRPNPSSSKAD